MISIKKATLILIMAFILSGTIVPAMPASCPAQTAGKSDVPKSVKKIVAGLAHEQKVTICLGRMMAFFKKNPDCADKKTLKSILDRLKLERRLGKCRRGLERCYEKREAVSFKDVVGGIGWIFGLAGMAMAVAALKKGQKKG